MAQALVIALISLFSSFDLPAAYWYADGTVHQIQKTEDSSFVEEMDRTLENVEFVVCTTETFVYFKTVSLLPFKIGGIFVDKESSTITFDKNSLSLFANIIETDGRITMLKINLE